jgi:catabolite regulation protein CreA
MTNQSDECNKIDDDTSDSAASIQQLIPNKINSQRLLSGENIGKLIFTHMASFILGATL